MTLIVDGYAISYVKKGKGPAVFLIHGWGDKKETFIDAIDALSEKYTVYALDLPGFGSSDTPRETFDLEKYALVVKGFVEKVGIVKPYAYIGHSNGGAIAIKALATGILSSDKLVLLSSSGVRSTYSGRKSALRIVAKAAKVPTKLLPQHMQKSIRKKVYASIGSDLFVAEHLQETFKKIVAEDVVHEAAMIHIPTLLIYGEHDSATPVAYGQKFAQQIENSTLKIIDDAGHFVHQDKARDVDALILEFLR